MIYVRTSHESWAVLLANKWHKLNNNNNNNMEHRKMCSNAISTGMIENSTINVAVSKSRQSASQTRKSNRHKVRHNAKSQKLEVT